MKNYPKYLFVPALLFVVGLAASAQAQNDAEVPGDHFSLEGALELFKKAASPEEFERMLNSPDAKVNNLDLNGDGDIDYIRVIDKAEGNVHAFILQAVISPAESQDVAVIELEKLANGKAVLQIVGDADIYGIETIIEPTEEVRVNAGTMTSRAVVNVWAWPSVQYIYGPYYSAWLSPWGWGYRPFWWRPWRPIDYYVYYPYWAPYRPYYSLCHTHRVVYAHRIYRPYRSTSVIVYDRHRPQIARYRSTRDFSTERERSYRDGRGSGYQDGRPGRNSGRESSYESTRSYRSVQGGERRTMTTTDRSSSAGRTRTQHFSTPSVTPRSDKGEQRISTPTERSWSHRSTPNVSQRPSSSPRTLSSPAGRSQFESRPQPTPHRSSGVQQRSGGGGHRPATIQPGGGSRNSQPAQRSGGGGSRGSSNGRGRN